MTTDQRVRARGVDVDRPLRGRAHVIGDDVPSEMVASLAARTGAGGLLITGRGFPHGLAHDGVVEPLIRAGVAAVISESMSGGFFRASVKLGLPAFALPGVAGVVADGDEVEVFLREARVRSLRTGAQCSGTPMPRRIAIVLRAGGARAFVAGRYGPPTR